MKRKRAADDNLQQADRPRRGESHQDWVERLFNEHNASLMNFLRARVRSSEEAREVAQEAYVRMLQLDKPQAISYFRAFLFKTAGNIAIDRLRKSARERERPVFPMFDGEAPSAEQTATRRQTIRMVERSLEELPPKCRKAFLLSRIYGLSTKEIADQMHMTARMIRNYLVKATLHIEKSLDTGQGD